MTRINSLLTYHNVFDVTDNLLHCIERSFSCNGWFCSVLYLNFVFAVFNNILSHGYEINQ